MTSREQLTIEIKNECDKIINEYYNTKSYIANIRKIVTIELQKKTNECNDWSSIILDFIGDEEHHRDTLVDKIKNSTIPLDYPGYHLGYKFHINRLYEDNLLNKRELELFERLYR
jgi:hypothetical protein